MSGINQRRFEVVQQHLGSPVQYSNCDLQASFGFVNCVDNQWLNRPDEWTNIVLHRLPDGINLYPAIVMHQPMSHSYNLPPRNLRMCVTKVCGHPVRRFSDDLKLFHNRGLMQLAAAKTRGV